MCVIGFEWITRAYKRIGSSWQTITRKLYDISIASTCEYEALVYVAVFEFNILLYYFQSVPNNKITKLADRRNFCFSPCLDYTIEQWRLNERGTGMNLACRQAVILKLQKEKMGPYGILPS